MTTTTMKAMSAKGLIAVSLLAFCASQAYAACELRRHMTIKQSNGWSVRCTFNQNGIDVGGDCTARDRGDVSGTLKGSRLKISVSWHGGSRGIYTGSVDDDGTLTDGFTYDEAHPGSTAKWRFTKPLRCD